VDVKRIASLAAQAARTGVATARVAHRAGLTEPVRPDRLLGMTAALRHWGGTAAGVTAANAARDPAGIAVIDERETLTYAEVDRRSSIVAAALADRGIGPDDTVALLVRNSAAFLVAMVAVTKLGADVLYLNTGFAGPQLADVLESERAAAVVADDEFRGIVDQHGGARPCLWAWVDDGDEPADSVGGVVAAASGVPDLPSPDGESRHIILTSGTTGRPKGAARGTPRVLDSALSGISLLDAIPYRAKGVTVLAAPAFHAWGLGNVTIATLLRSTLVMARRFDPEQTLRLVATHGADAVAAVPVMCQRMLDVDADIALPTLRIVALSGSALAPTLATRFMDRFGDVLYSLYGSTEIAYVSVAGPADLREEPTTAGRVLRGVGVRIVDADGHDVPEGEVGRIFAGSGVSFEGYTSGEDKVRLDGLASIGDLGRFGPDGRLYVEGRDDDMIVSGGENVFPAEVEDVLHRHPAVSDVAVVGVPDERFGQALVAHVVLRGGSTATPAELRAHVKAELASYKVPREVVLVDALPRNETGKVVKRKLADPSA
jgi:fatty-acyl-CoA synthase